MKYLIFSIFLIPLITFGQNNTQSIRGNITDKLSQNPIVGAAIEITSLQMSSYSDSLGNYSLSSISPGRYEIKIYYKGYKTLFIPNILIT